MLRSKPKPELTVHRDGRVELRGALYHKMRVSLCDLADSKCEICGRYTNLASGEVDHVIIRGMGGARRDDRIFVDGKRQLLWKCRPCHLGRHAGEKPVTQKPKLSEQEFNELMGIAE